MPSPVDRQLRLLLRHSADPRDVALAGELLRHLDVLKRFSGIDVWTDARIRAGDETRNEIQRAIQQADVALLLLSADFFGSDSMQEFEFPRLLERHRAGHLRVIPVLARSCLWQIHPWLEELHPLPKDQEPIASRRGDARDRALTELVKEIEAIAVSGSVNSRRQVAGAPTGTFDARGTQEYDIGALSAMMPSARLRGVLDRHRDRGHTNVITLGNQDLDDLRSATDATDDDLSRLHSVTLRSIQQVSLVIVDISKEDDNGSLVRLQHNPSFLGRSSFSDIVIDDRGVSRRHAEIELEDGRLFLRDLGSSSGTYCNGHHVGGGIQGNSRVVGEMMLKSNDAIQFGPRIWAIVLFESLSELVAEPNVHGSKCRFCGKAAVPGHSVCFTCHT